MPGFDHFIGDVFLFYGVDNHMFKLDDTVWEAIEDENDGYRSMLECVSVTHGGIFRNQPITIVELREAKRSDLVGYELVDDNQHVWLSIGTDESDDYYPSYVFRYEPGKIPITPIKPSPTNSKQVDSFDRLFSPRET